MSSATKTLHQFIAGASPGDAITDYALLIRHWLRTLGYKSVLYAESVHPALTDDVRSYLTYRAGMRGELVILHHSIGSELIDFLIRHETRVLLIYHNITPAAFFEDLDPSLVSKVRLGRVQLRTIKPNVSLALGVSEYDEEDLKSLGYPSTGVLPLVLDVSSYEFDDNADLRSQFRDGGPNLLFVGRLAPNKRQDDLIRLLYYVRRVLPGARLFLVGSRWMPSYAAWIEELAEECEVADSVHLPGHVSQRDLVTYYRLADCYVSMSEHEGFGKPLIEAMYFGVPVLAYRSTAIPETLGGAGILFTQKDCEALAEFIGLLCNDERLRHRIVVAQRQRVEDFLEPIVLARLESYLASLRF